MWDFKGVVMLNGGIIIGGLVWNIKWWICWDDIWIFGNKYGFLSIDVNGR